MLCAIKLRDLTEDALCVTRLLETQTTRPFMARPRRDTRPKYPRPRRDRDSDDFDRDETETRRRYVSRPSRDRDVETETTSLPTSRAAGPPTISGISQAEAIAGSPDRVPSTECLHHRIDIV